MCITIGFHLNQTCQYIKSECITVVYKIIIFIFNNLSPDNTQCKKCLKILGNEKLYNIHSKYCQEIPPENRNIFILYTILNVIYV